MTAQSYTARQQEIFSVTFVETAVCLVMPLGPFGWWTLVGGGVGWLTANSTTFLDLEQALQEFLEFGRIQTSVGFYGVLEGRLQQLLLAISKDGYCTFGAGNIATINEFSDHGFQTLNENDAYPTPD